MKTPAFILLLFSLLLFVFVSFAPAKKKFVPPGMVQVTESLFFDETEVSNKQWKEFETWTGNRFGFSTPQHAETLPDTSVWRKELAFNDGYTEFYHQHPGYNGFPVVGITWEQAVNYCKWKTDRIREQLQSKAFQNQIKPKTINCRLPTPAEWEMVASAGLNEKQQRYLDRKKDHPNNLRRAVPKGSAVKLNPNATITAPVKSYFPNTFGLYNLIGNVAEMTTTKGTAKGGSWNDKPEAVTVQATFPYEGATAWVGLRCVCEVEWH